MQPAGLWDDRELRRLFDDVDNASRWGPDDELGTLNYITPAKRIEAARLVRTGETVSLALPLAGRDAPLVEHRMLSGHRGRPPGGVPASAGDFVGLDIHQPGLTHLDCVSHVASPDGRVYNRRRFEDVIGPDGVAFGSVYAQRHGIVSRGVLLDVAAALGVDWLEPTYGIRTADLDAAERYGGIGVGRGDVLVLRAGNETRTAAQGRHRLSAGLAPECLRWLHQREVALYAGDAPEWITSAGARVFGADSGEFTDPFETAFPLPLHQIGLAAMGLVLLDHCRVDELAQNCARLGRHEFLFMVAPLPLVGVTGSPVNPIAVF